VQNPHISLAYIAQPHAPTYADCIATWIHERDEQLRIWDLHKTLPPPLGFDPTPQYGTIDRKYFGLLRLDPWRSELAQLDAESRIWRSGIR